MSATRSHFVLLESLILGRTNNFRQDTKVNGKAWRAGLTEEILHEVPIHGAILEASKGHNRGRDLANAEVLRLRSEDVLGVESLGLNLTRDLAVGEHCRGEDGCRPVGARFVEDGLVEDVVAAEVGVGAAREM